MTYVIIKQEDILKRIDESILNECVNKLRVS
jgi:hypothetical protein